MATGSMTVTGSVAALPYGSVTIGPVTVTSAAAEGAVVTVVLASGANTITVPTTITPSAMLIVFNPASATTKTIKGVGGDTGLVAAKTGFVLLCFDTTAVPATFVINSSAVDTGNLTYIYFL